MKKVLVVLMVLVSLSMFGKISEDQYFKKETHTKWFENFKNNNSYSIEANKFLYTKVLSFYNKNKKVSVVRYICEVIRTRNIVETSTTSAPARPASTVVNPPVRQKTKPPRS